MHIPWGESDPGVSGKHVEQSSQVHQSGSSRTGSGTVHRGHVNMKWMSCGASGTARVSLRTCNAMQRSCLKELLTETTRHCSVPDKTGWMDEYHKFTHMISRRHVPNLGASSMIVVDTEKCIVFIVPAKVGKEHPDVQHWGINARNHVVHDCEER